MKIKFDSYGVLRFLVERRLPPGVLDGLVAARRAQVNENNARFGVVWLMSYANAEKTRVYCVYEGPSEVAIRMAAVANGLPVDAITEVPETLLPQ